MIRPVFTLQQVIASELEEITERRCAARLAKSDRREDNQSSGVNDDLVGLALSGGGIRSAAFNWGLLLAMLKSDTVRYVDYLSTVSGGGYIGSRFTSWCSVAGCQADQFTWSLQGDYLNRRFRAANHYAGGFLL